MTDSGWKMADGLESRNLSHSRAERDRQLEELSEAVKLKKIWEDVPEVGSAFFPRHRVGFADKSRVLTLVQY